MTNKYIVQLMTKDKKFIQAIHITESTRKSKVLQQINKLLAKEHNITLEESLNFEVYKIK